MACGFFKKIKNAFKKAEYWVKNKVIKPAVDTAKKVFTPDNIKKVVANVIGVNHPCLNHSRTKSDDDIKRSC